MNGAGTGGFVPVAILCRSTKKKIYSFLVRKNSCYSFYVTPRKLFYSFHFPLQITDT